MNTSDDATTDCMQCAQCCMVSLSACVASFMLLSTCEGGGDVVGAQVVLHGDQVVELSVLLGMHEEGEVEEDGEGQVEV